RRAHWRRPNDFWINVELAFRLGVSSSPNWPEAVRHLTAAASCRPRSPAIYVNLSTALMNAGAKREDVVAACEKGLGLDPLRASLHCNLGMALLGVEPDRALAAYREAIRIDPKSAKGFANFGNALFKVGRLKE